MIGLDVNHLGVDNQEIGVVNSIISQQVWL